MLDVDTVDISSDELEAMLRKIVQKPTSNFWENIDRSNSGVVSRTINIVNVQDNSKDNVCKSNMSNP